MSLPCTTKLSSESAHFIGICKAKNKKSISYLDKESWVDSIATTDALTSSDQEEVGYTRHFFVPNDLATRLDEVSPIRTAEDDIVVCLHGDLAIIKNGMKFNEPRHLGD